MLRPAEGRVVTHQIAYRPALGPPEQVGSELTLQLNEAAVENGIALVIDSRVETSLALRGYLTAMRKGPAINVTYLWDVIDAKGHRVHRFVGEEALASGIDVKQPWAAVTPAVARIIAQKAMGDIGRWAAAHPQPASERKTDPPRAAPERPASSGSAEASTATGGGTAVRPDIE